MKELKRFMGKATMILFALLMSVSLAACGDDDADEPGDGEGAATSLIGTWGMSGYIEDGEYMSTTITFRNDGTCVVSESFESDPSEDYTVTVNYSVDGDLSIGATLDIWGRTIDGEYTEMSYIAVIKGNTLRLDCIKGEGVGEVLVLKRQ